MINPTAKQPTLPPTIFILAPVLFAIPLIIAALWGTPLGDGVYLSFAYARNLAAGRELAFDLTGASAASPTYVLLWMLLDWAHIPLLPASVVLSGLGWSATALAVYGIGRSLGRPLAATSSAILIVFSPFVASTLGTEFPWALALFWIATWLALRGDWQVQGGVLAWMLWAHFDWMMLAWAIVMLGLQWHEQRHLPSRSTLALAVVVLARVLISIYAFSVPLPPLRFGLVGLSDLRQLLAESDWYWLWLPLVGLGLLNVRQKAVWIGLLGCLLVSIGSGSIAGSCLLVGSALLAGWGIDWSAKWVEARALVRSIRFHRHIIPVSVWLALITLVPLSVAQISSLRHRSQARPLSQYEIERQVGTWLSSHSDPTAIVMGSARIGYLADRPLLLWDGTARDQEQMSLLMDVLNAFPPEYCVSTNVIAWSWLTQTGWFQDRYELLGRYETAYDARSPFLVWGYQTSGFDRGQIRSMDSPLSEGVRLVRSQHWPERIVPGDSIYVTLYFQSTQTISSAFQTHVRVFSPTDGANWAHQNRKTPFSMPVDWWQPGQVIAERFVLTTTTETPVGAYPLDLSISGTRIEGLVLGYVSVPWQGTLDGATRIKATFSDQIRLLGFEVPETGAVGSEIQVTLYWEALRPPDDDYIAFVHLVGPAGQPATSHDGVPMNRRYSTLGWSPGDIVPDTHPLPLKPDTPPGTYSVQVGMYRWPGMERLPVRDSAGTEQPDQTIALSTIEIR